MRKIVVGLALTLPLLAACHRQPAGLTLPDSASNRNADTSAQHLQSLLPPGNPPH